MSADPTAIPMPPGATRAFALDVARHTVAHLREINGRNVLRNLRRHPLWVVLRVYASAPSCSAANAAALETVAAAFERHRITWAEASQAPRERASRRDAKTATATPVQQRRAPRK